MEQVDILYIHPTKSFTDTMYSVMPVGVIALLNLLKNQGFNVKGINIGIERSLNSEYSLRHELKSIDYKALLLDLHWYEHSYGAIQIAEMSKTVYPHIPVIIGGYTSTIYANEILTNFSCIDYVLKGDSEEPISKLLKYIIKHAGRLENIPNISYRSDSVIVNKELTYTCCNIDSLDFCSCGFIKNKDYIYLTSPRGVIKQAAKTFWVCMARGCNYNCTYCCGSKRNAKVLFGRENIVVRSPEIVANDIELLTSEGVKIISPTHDFTMLGENYYKALFNKLKERGVRVGLYLECFQLPSKEILLDIKETFDTRLTRVEISPLTGDEAIRKENGKLFSNTNLYEILDFMVGNNINIEIYYSMNLANEDSTTFARTLNQMKDIIVRYGHTSLRLICRRVVLDPLAPMRDDKYNICSHLNKFLDYYNYCKSGDNKYTGYEDKHSDNMSERFSLYDKFKEEMLKLKQVNNLKFSIS